MILACRSGCVNVKILVEGKWCPGYLEDVWYILDNGRHLFSVWSATGHRISVIIKRQRVLLQHDAQLVTSGGWMIDTYAMDRHVVFPREPVEVNSATTSETLQLWHEHLGHQDKSNVRKVLEWMEMPEIGGFCDGCVLGKHTGSLSFHGWIDHRSSVS
jgi:hypothetical protein